MIARSLCLPVAVAALCAATACTRMDDGTMVPSYTPQLVTTGLLPHVALRETAPRRARIAVYPPAPRTHLVASIEPLPRQRVRPRRQRISVPFVRAEAAPPPVQSAGGLSCRNEGANGGRVRVVCD